MTAPFRAYSPSDSDLTHKRDQALSRTGKQWIVPTAQEKDVLFLQQKYGVCDLTARLSAHRMDNLEQAEEIFSPYIKQHLPDPALLPDGQKGFDCITQALTATDTKPWAVWGDYDVDGACAAALLVKYFRALNIPITPYIPDRFQEGYGPNIQGLRALKAQGIHHIFVVDCGTNALQIMDQAAQEGLSIIIIDHHRVGPEHPQAVAFVNPKRADVLVPSILTQLCAGGLVFVFLVGLNRHLRWTGYFTTKNIKEPDLFSLLDLVALSTICDMMPLRHINRAFVKQGLKVMRQRQNIGLTCLIDAAKINDVPNPTHLAYTVGPRINAGGRIGDASLGVRLLSCTDKQESLLLAQELTSLNYERQTIERATWEKAVLQAHAQHTEGKPYVFVHGHDWHEGVLGIIASQLKEAFHKPAFVMTVKGSFLKGSVRSVPGIDISHFIHLAYAEGLLVTGGGHPMAGGLTCSLDKHTALLGFLDDFLCTFPVPDHQPYFIVDATLTFEQLRHPQFMRMLDTVGPFGVDYPQPKFVLSGLRLQKVQTFGYNHLRMLAVQPNGMTYPMVYFRQADKPLGQWLLTQPSELVQCLISVQADQRWGYQRAQLILEDIR